MKSLFVLPLLALPLIHAAEPTVSLAGIQVVFDDGEKDFDEFRFYSKDGTPVKAERVCSSWMGGFLGSKGSGDVSYRFKAMPTDLILAVETWTGREEINLKVDFTAGHALPNP